MDKVNGDCEVDGHAILAFVDGVVDVSENLDVDCVENDDKE